jgi:hypothetical protein
MGQVRRTVHVPTGGDTERALGLPCQPASCHLSGNFFPERAQVDTCPLSWESGHLSAFRSDKADTGRCAGRDEACMTRGFQLAVGTDHIQGFP